MYDLSGLPGGQIERVIEDWKRLVDEKYTKDAAYQRHNGKPVVSIWGFGFNDGRKYTLAEGMKLVDFLKNAHQRHRTTKTTQTRSRTPIPLRPAGPSPPFKARRGHPLTPEQTAWNRHVSEYRIGVEHTTSRCGSVF